MRGIVMVLMALDHASHAFNAGRYTRDSFMWYPAGSEIPAIQFLVRWVTHLCAPTFLFLAGFVLALSVARRLSRGEPQRSMDISLLIRGVFILLLDPLWMSFGFGGATVFQVLYAIGGSFCLMIPLRRFGIRSLFAFGLGILVFGEALALWAGMDQRPGLMSTFLVTGGPVTQGIYVLYPLLPWFAYMVLGWVCGAYLLQSNNVNPVRFFTLAGIISILVFLIFRGFNQYGNMLLYRFDNSIVQWLHVSKYPPSFSFAALELGLMFLTFAIVFGCYRNRTPSAANPLQVFGRTPLFFYILHVHLLAVAAWALNLHRAGGLVETGLATLVVLGALYPLCRFYDRFKRAHPKSLLRYV
jgi:uncharacterized membrane protein